MTLTVQGVGDQIRQTLAGDISPEVSIRLVMEQAGSFLASLHDWNWMRRTARLNLRASITVTDGTWTEATRSLTLTDAFEDYVWVQGDEFKVTGGTGATTGFYEIASRTSDDVVVLDTSIGAAANGSATIDGTLALDAIALPSDFKKFMAVQGSDVAVNQLEMVDWQDLLDLRSGSTSQTSGRYFGSIKWVGSPTTLQFAPKPRLEIWPSVATSQSSAFNLSYYADWGGLPTGDTSVLPLPRTFAIEHLYMQIVRAMARGYDEEDQASMQRRLAEVVGGPEMAAAIQADGTQQVNLGKMRGGAATLGNPFEVRRFTLNAPG